MTKNGKSGKKPLLCRIQRVNLKKTKHNNNYKTCNYSNSESNTIYPLSSGRLKYTANQHFSQLKTFQKYMFKEHSESQEKQQQLELINLSVPKCKSDKKLQLLNAATINSSQVTLNA